MLRAAYLVALVCHCACCLSRWLAGRLEYRLFRTRVAVGLARHGAYFLIGFDNGYQAGSDVSARLRIASGCLPLVIPLNTSCITPASLQIAFRCAILAYSLFTWRPCMRY